VLLIRAGIERQSPTGGDYTVRAVAIDGDGRFSKPTNITVTFNNPPVLARDFLMVFSGSGSNELQVLLNDRDPDGDPLTVTWATNTVSPAKGTFNVTGGKLFYTPNAGEYGRDYFLYTASDGRGGVATTNASVMILPPWVLEEFDQVVNITFPTNNTPITSPMVITGNVASPYLRSYQLQYQRVVYPMPAWTTFAEGDIGVTIRRQPIAGEVPTF
jgi:hypothetical protein